MGRPAVDLPCFFPYSEFNYVKNANDECVLVPGTQPLPSEEMCKDGEEFWYERTPYRLIPYSTCEDGIRPDRGKAHRCPGFKAKGAWFWLFMLLIPFAFTSLVGYYYYRKSGLARGYVESLSSPFLFSIRTSLPPPLPWAIAFFILAPELDLDFVFFCSVPLCVCPVPDFMVRYCLEQFDFPEGTTAPQ